jgi:AbrB family looped-hinge helix DNA binding protein
MEYELTRLSSKGQLVIPSHMRKALGLRTGTRLAMFTDGEHILLKPIAAPDVLAFRRLVVDAKRITAKVVVSKKRGGE